MSKARFEILHDATVIEEFLRRDPYLHLYSLGDLDPLHWPHTCWYGLRGQSGLEALVLGYTATHPVILAYASAGEEGALGALLAQLRPYLPRRFYAHATPGTLSALQPDYQTSIPQNHCKMALVDHEKLATCPAEGELLYPGNQAELEEFYAQAYPGNWFEPRMLGSQHYFGIRRAGRLAAVAGVHVYAPQRKVAALGNIATHPDFRGQGLAAAVTARLCLHLKRSVELVGLNVSEHNQAAIRCYQKLGFQTGASYQEFQATGANLE